MSRQRFGQRDRERVRLLACRTAGVPDPQARLAFAPADLLGEFRDDRLCDELEVMGFAVKVRLVSGDAVDERADLGVARPRRQHLVVGPERGQTVVAQALLEARLDQLPACRR